MKSLKFAVLFSDNFIRLLPEIFLISVGLFLLLYGVLWNNSKLLKGTNILNQILGLSLFTIIISLFFIFNDKLESSNIFDTFLVVNDFSLISKMILLFSTIIVFIVSFYYIKNDKLNSFEYPILILFATSGLLLLISSNNFISLYLALEYQSLCLYILASLQRTSEFSIEAGLKYFVLGALASGFLLFGISLIYGFTGITNFDELQLFLYNFNTNGPIQDLSISVLISSLIDTANIGGGFLNSIDLTLINKIAILDSNTVGSVINNLQFCSEDTIKENSSLLSIIRGDAFSFRDLSLIVQEKVTPLAQKDFFFSLGSVNVGFFFLIGAILFKLTAAPFHMWAPDVYEGSPTPVTVFFSIVPKVAFIFLLLKIYLQICYELLPYWGEILSICGILSLLLGSFAAIGQVKLKRLLAYSGIVHVGFLLLGFLIGNIYSIQNIYTYLVIYIFMSIGIFSIILALRNIKENFRVLYLNDLISLKFSQPFLAISLALLMFSMAGVPPLAGFFSKFLILLSTIAIEEYLISIIIILTSVIACFYYLRIINLMYFPKIVSWILFNNISKEYSYSISFSICFIIFFLNSYNIILNLFNKISLL